MLAAELLGPKPSKCGEVWLRGQISTRGERYFRFAGVVIYDGADEHESSLIEVPSLSLRLRLAPEAMVAQTLAAQQRLESMRMLAYMVLVQPDGVDELWRREGHDRSGRALSLTGLSSLAMDVQCLSVPTVGETTIQSPCRAGMRLQDGWRSTGRACDRGTGRVGTCPRKSRAVPLRAVRRCTGLVEKHCPGLAALPEALPDAIPQCLLHRDWAALVDIGPYHDLASFLDALDLSSIDACCSELRMRNCALGGPWRSRGAVDFHGAHFEQHGLFLFPATTVSVNWKGRYMDFSRKSFKFCYPFAGTIIQMVQEADECVELLCGIRTDLLTEVGLYIEIDVASNSDTLTLSLVDWHDGGCNSITFSPDAGMVFLETTVCDSPRRVEGKFVSVLSAHDSGARTENDIKCHFHGTVGLFVLGGRIAFFRRCRPCQEVEVGGSTEGTKVNGVCWETTGFIKDLSWAVGSHLMPCVAFRKAGMYDVRVGKVCPQPPMPLDAIEAATAAKVGPWQEFDWE